MTDLIVQAVPGKGRGVFADRDFNVGEVLCCCPVVVLSRAETSQIRKCSLNDYVFDWPDAHETIRSPRWSCCAIVLGIGSLLNHSRSPNVIWVIQKKNLVVNFLAKRRIYSGEELVLDYDWPKSRTKNFLEVKP